MENCSKVLIPFYYEQPLDRCFWISPAPENILFSSGFVIGEGLVVSLAMKQLPGTLSTSNYEAVIS